MVNTMKLLRDVYQQKAPFNKGLTDKNLREKARKAFDKGVDCILRCQIRVNGKPTVWCQQQDRETFAPAPARAFELPSFCSSESANIVKLLLEIPNPSEEIKEAVRGAMQWFDDYKLTGLKVVRTGEYGSPYRNTTLVKDPAGTPLWARFYDLKNCEPFVCDRDGIPRKSMQEIGTDAETDTAGIRTHQPCSTRSIRNGLRNMTKPICSTSASTQKARTKPDSWTSPTSASQACQTSTPS